MLVRVTQEHIDKGKRNDTYACSIALAVATLFPHQLVCVISSWLVTYTGSYDLPVTARKFIYDYDRQRTVKPFEFELTVDR